MSDEGHRPLPKETGRDLHAGSVQRYREPLIKYFSRRGVPDSTAEDLAQDCFTRLFGLASRDHIENVEAYLFQTAASVFADHVEYVHKREASKHVPFDFSAFETEATGAPGQDRVLEAKEAVAHLRIVLLELKPRTREIFLLNRLDGFSYTQIAVRFGMTNKGVEWHMHEALSQNGEPKIERGLVKADDVKAIKALRRKLATPDDDGHDGEDGAATTGSAQKPPIPAKLLDELMAHKTLTLRAEVASRPDLALRLLVLALASNALNEFGAFSLVRVRIDEADVSRQITRSESAAPKALAKLAEAWRERLPSGVDALWTFISDADQQTLLELTAVLVAPAIELRHGRAESVVDAICAAAGLDMSKYWSATPGSYFEHVRKDVILDAIKQVNPALDRTKLDKASKKEVLDRARKAFKGKTWLPEPLRSHSAAIEAPIAVAAE